MRTGLDQLLQNPAAILKGRRIGLASHASGTSENCLAGIDCLHQHPDVHLVKTFGAEHGLRGEVPAGDPVEDGRDAPTGLPLWSLYGPRRAPTAEMLADIDLLVLDFQDIGSRYYTFISTTVAIIAAALEQGTEVLVLDRPNPLGGETRGGNVLTTDQLSFVGALPIPMQHGMTLGELVRWHFGTPTGLTILPMQGWSRGSLWEDVERPWIPPSPNSTGPGMARLYPGTCLIEGTNLSEGRGTPYPFEVIGAPFIDPYQWADHLNAWDLPGVRFRPLAFRPTTSKFVDTVVYGVHVHQVKPREVCGTLVGFALLAGAATLWPDEFQFGRFFELLGGDPELREMMRRGMSPFAVEAHYQADRDRFLAESQHAWLYPVS